MAEVTTKTTTTTTKSVTIDLGRNVVWEVDKVELTEKYSYWWSKPQLKQFRQDYQNEAMLEGVKNLVRAKIQKDFDDPDVVEERVEKIMKLEPADIADFLQAGAKSNAKAKGKTNSNTAPKDSNNSSSNNNNNNSNISNPPERKAQRVADHRICELLGTCNCPVKQKITPKAPWMATTEPESESDSDDDDGSSSSSSSDDDTDDDDSSSSSSSSSDDDDSDDDDTDEEEYDEEDDESTGIPEIDDDSYSVPEPEFLWEAPVLPSVPYSSVFDDDDDDETNSLTTSDLDGNDDAIAGEGTQTKTPDAYMDDIDAIRRKFRQGSLAVLAMEKLKRMVKTQSEPQQQQQQEQDQPQAMWSSSSRLLDMYTASDDEESDDEKGNEKEETPETKIDQDKEQYPTTSEHEHTTRSTDSGDQDNESDSDSDSDDDKGGKETSPSTTSDKERGSDNHNVGHDDNIDDDEENSDYDDNDNDNDDNGSSSSSSSSRDDDTEEHLSDDAEHCPVCRGLVDPSYQKRRIILLRQTLCKRCFRAHYLDDTDTETETETDTESPGKTTTARRKKPALRLGKYEHIERNTKRDVRILRSLARD